jgi:hypothetical protein
MLSLFSYKKQWLIKIQNDHFGVNGELEIPFKGIDEG